MAAVLGAPCPFADGAKHLVGPVDGANLRRGGLADAQAAGIHDGEACLVDRVADAAEKLPDLILRQRIRQPLLPRRGDPFFPEQPPGTAERVVVEETQAVLAGLEGAACNRSLAQAEQVGSHLFLAELIG